MKNYGDAWKQREEVVWFYDLHIMIEVNVCFFSPTFINKRYNAKLKEIWAGEDDQPSLPLRPRKFEGHDRHADQHF